MNVGVIQYKFYVSKVYNQQINFPLRETLQGWSLDKKYRVQKFEVSSLSLYYRHSAELWPTEYRYEPSRRTFHRRDQEE